MSASSNQVYRVRRIIIDPGHGGRDVGAKGFEKKYCEKQATLDIAKRVAEVLKEEDPNRGFNDAGYGQIYFSQVSL